MAPVAEAEMTGLDRERLAKLLGMWARNHDSEIAAAGRMADAMVRGVGLTWGQVIEPPAAVLSAPRSRRLGRKEMLHLCLWGEDLLTDWESTFIASIARQRRPWPPKQAAVIKRIADKILDAIGGVQ